MPPSKWLKKDLEASRISWNKQKTPNADSNGHSIRKGPVCKIPFYPCDSTSISLSSINQIWKVERRHMRCRRPPPRFLHISMLLNTSQQTNYSPTLRDNVCSLKLYSNRNLSRNLGFLDFSHSNERAKTSHLLCPTSITWTPWHWGLKTNKCKY